jgi:hypothetical protein
MKTPLIGKSPMLCATPMRMELKSPVLRMMDKTHKTYGRFRTTSIVEESSDARSVTNLSQATVFSNKAL